MVVGMVGVLACLTSSLASSLPISLATAAAAAELVEPLLEAGGVGLFASLSALSLTVSQIKRRTLHRAVTGPSRLSHCDVIKLERRQNGV